VAARRQSVARRLRWRRRLGAFLAATVTALLVAGMAAVPAFGHAVLLEVEPADRAVLREAPAQVRITFNEPVQAPTGGLRVYDANANRVDEGELSIEDPASVAVGLPADLPDGGYVVTYRVVSTDSHPIAGATSFVVGSGEAVDQEVVAQLFAGTGGGTTGPAGPLLRGLGALATLLAGGAVAFSVWVARADPDRAAARRLGVRAAAAGAALGLLAIPVQGAAVTGAGLLGTLEPAVLSEVLRSTFGAGTAVRVVWLAALALLWRARAHPAAVVAAAVAAVGSYALDGHQRTFEPTWLLMGADVLHVLAAATWFGGLVLLAGALTRGGRQDPVTAARLVARFSSMALVTVAVLGLAGAAMARLLVGSASALLPTTYGRLLLAKVLAVGVVLVVATYNRWWLVPAVAGTATSGLPDPAWRRLRATVRLEAGVLGGVVLLTGFLVVTQPAVDAASGAGLHQATETVGDGFELDLVVDPNRVGRNTLHLYALDPAGRPAEDATDLALELTYLPEGIGPIPVQPFRAGPGHWVATIDDLTFPGDWELRAVVGFGRFDEREVRFVVPVSGR